jgi:hypothetical protein
MCNVYYRRKTSNTRYLMIRVVLVLSALLSLSTATTYESCSNKGVFSNFTIASSQYDFAYTFSPPPVAWSIGTNFLNNNRDFAVLLNEMKMDSQYDSFFSSLISPTDVNLPGFYTLSRSMWPDSISAFVASAFNNSDSNENKLATLSSVHSVVNAYSNVLVFENADLYATLLPKSCTNLSNTSQDTGIFLDFTNTTFVQPVTYAVVLRATNSTQKNSIFDSPVNLRWTRNVGSNFQRASDGSYARPYAWAGISDVDTGLSTSDGFMWTLSAIRLDLTSSNILYSLASPLLGMVYANMAINLTGNAPNDVVETRIGAIMLITCMPPTTNPEIVNQHEYNSNASQSNSSSTSVAYLKWKKACDEHNGIVTPTAAPTATPTISPTINKYPPKSISPTYSAPSSAPSYDQNPTQAPQIEVTWSPTSIPSPQFSIAPTTIEEYTSTPLKEEHGDLPKPSSNANTVVLRNGLIVAGLFVVCYGLLIITAKKMSTYRDMQYRNALPSEFEMRRFAAVSGELNPEKPEQPPPQKHIFYTYTGSEPGDTKNADNNYAAVSNAHKLTKGQESSYTSLMKGNSFNVLAQSDYNSVPPPITADSNFTSIQPQLPPHIDSQTNVAHNYGKFCTATATTTNDYASLPLSVSQHTYSPLPVPSLNTNENIVVYTVSNSYTNEDVESRENTEIDLDNNKMANTQQEIKYTVLPALPLPALPAPVVHKEAIGNDENQSLSIEQATLPEHLKKTRPKHAPPPIPPTDFN